MMRDNASAAEPEGPRQENFGAALRYSLTHPTAIPAGTNDWSCEPTEAHPEPVVLVHGTVENRYAAWSALAPKLKDAGYCVYALNYGGKEGGAVQGMASMHKSAQQLADFVDKVRSETGAAKVDLVGHSQGGLMSRHYIKAYGGADKVDKLIALSPPNHGTTMGGMTYLANPISDLLTRTACPSCFEQMAGSEFLKALNGGGETKPDIAYTVISTTKDKVVTPYISTFLRPATNVINQRLQDYCGSEDTGHNDMGYSPSATRLVLNALNPGQTRQPAC
ncbi:triacylglycerol lipase [Streptomyces sp. NA04227]|nr:triacylglycerol lipase [Streptomyces sp. NA04227]